jgi:hypothetical protein
MTGKNVTECTGGARALSGEDLQDRSHCDPRRRQALELAFLVADRYHTHCELPAAQCRPGVFLPPELAISCKIGR